MAFKVLYIEDNDPASIQADLEGMGFEVIHHDPAGFEDAIQRINNDNIDLLLLDFRLSDKTAIYDAPTIAQTIRTKNTGNHRDLPIVLISSEDNISGYYKDYTSQDLFDFSISKKQMSENLDKYTARMKSLIEGYSAIKDTSSDSSKSLIDLLALPKPVANKFNIRVKEFLQSVKCRESTYMASDFILNHIVKPSGLLIGGDILAARLGVSITSPHWEHIKSLLDEHKYTGLFSDAYERWWSVGLEIWWKSISSDNPSLKRLRSKERKSILEEKLGLTDLVEAQKSEHSKSDYFWTICSKLLTPLDAIDGFEKNSDKEAWEDKEYFSILGVSELKSLNELRAIDRARYIELTGGN